MSRPRFPAQDFARRWREQGPKAAFTYRWEILRVQIYLEDEIVVRKDFAADATPEPGPVRLEVAQAHHLPMLAEFDSRQANATRTRRILRRFVIVEDEARRNRVRDVVRPLRAIGLSGRRD